MNKLPKITFVIFLFAVICVAQTPESTPIPIESIEISQREKIKQEKQDIESDEPRLRTKMFILVMEDNLLTTLSLFSKDDKKNQSPKFELLLTIREKQLGGSKEFFAETMKSQSRNLPKIDFGISSNPLNFKLIQSGIGSGELDGIPLNFRDEAYRMDIKSDLVDKILTTNSIEISFGNHKFSALENDLNNLKDFINKEREITKLSQEYIQSRKLTQPN